MTAPTGRRRTPSPRRRRCPPIRRTPAPEALTPAPPPSPVRRPVCAPWWTTPATPTRCATAAGWPPSPSASRTGPMVRRVSLYQSGRVGISCPTSSSCTAVVGDVGARLGRIFVDAGAVSVDVIARCQNHRITAISCPPAGQCLIVNGTELSVRAAGSGWSPRPGHRPTRWSSTRSPVPDPVVLRRRRPGRRRPAVERNRMVGARTMSFPPPASTRGSGPRCPARSAQFCMVLNSDGDYATYSGPGAR